MQYNYYTYVDIFNTLEILKFYLNEVHVYKYV